LIDLIDCSTSESGSDSQRRLHISFSSLSANMSSRLKIECKFNVYRGNISTEVWLANIMSESSHCFWKGNRNSGHRLCIMVCPSFWEDYYMLIYTHCWELMNSVGSHGSSSLPFVMKVMVCHFVSDSHEVMTALIVMLPLIVVVEISLQLHRSLFD
jgi:hypothetical protein